MNKKPNNLKQKTAILASTLLSEWILAFLLGTLPIIIFSSTKKDIDDITQGLLAIGSVVEYSAYLVAPYVLAFIIKHGIRFSSDKSKNTFDFIHKIIYEVGTGFLTITRTGLGVAFGILVLWLATDIVTVSTKQIAFLFTVIFSLTIVNCAFAFGKDILIEHTNKPSTKNPIKLSPKLK